MFSLKTVIILAIVNTVLSQSKFGTNKYTEFETGNFNLLISSPHDGSLIPSSIPDRIDDNGNLLRDMNTRPLAKEIAVELSKLLNKNASIVYNNLHRKKMDPNRTPTECCSDATLNTECQTAYNEYHTFITNYKTEMEKYYKQLLIIDVHGQSHADNWTEIGYLLTKTELNQPVLVETSKASVNALKTVYGYSLENVIRGEISLGAFIQRQDYKVVPSPAIKGPGPGDYYNGGYITSTHKSVNTNTIQIEFPYFVRSTSTIAKQNAVKIAKAIYDFYTFHNFGSLV